MFTTIHGVKITGMCTVVPERVLYFEDELKHFPFPEKSSRRLGRVMGFKEHRIADAQTTHCDLASYGMDYLFQKGHLNKETLPCMIVVSQHMDHLVPGNSKVIHGQLGLSKNTHCVDMYENCIGFIAGLQAACSLIASSDIDEVALVTTDGGSCRANINDRSSYPLHGDAAGITIVRRSENKEDKIHFSFQHDGSRREALLLPAGGARMPYSEETAKVVKDEMGNYRSLNDFHMDGTAVFQFVMEEVPPFLEELYQHIGIEKDSIEYHLTHQPNKFMCERLADMMNVSRDILFNNVVECFGNSSAATIPVNIVHNLGKRLITEKPLVCFSAFGAGLSLAAAIGDLGHLDFCDLIEHSGNGLTKYRETI